MKLKHSILLFFLVGITKIAAAQVKLLTLNQLESRINKASDTVYVVNFWATWCAPCVKELPNFEQLGKQYQNQPLKVILVSLDFKSKLEKVVKPFVKRNKLKSELYLLDEKSEQDYIDKISKNWSGSLPATLIINNKKKTRNFYEQEFTWEEIEKVYLINK
jgi:thiol-disulfide isomerase/thioredoxin